MDTIPAQNDPRASIRLLRLPEVMYLTGLGRSTIYQLVARGEFPKPVPLGSTCGVGWVESEVHDWIREQIAARR